jgi:hypothetical protein
MRDQSAYKQKYTQITVGLFAVIFFNLSLYAQNAGFDFTKAPEQGIRLRAEILDRDTIPVMDLGAVDVYGSPVFSSQKHAEQWTRLKFNVKKVYPYAILASAKLKEYDKVLDGIQDNNLRKAFIKQCERDLRSQFEGELKALTITQGKLLMKLIDREAGKTTYEIVKQMRGGFQATMWQALARVFGQNMKVEYGSDPDDRMVEMAIKVVEAGVF